MTNGHNRRTQTAMCSHSYIANAANKPHRVAGCISDALVKAQLVLPRRACLLICSPFSMEAEQKALLQNGQTILDTLASLGLENGLETFDHLDTTGWTLAPILHSTPASAHNNTVQYARFGHKANAEFKARTFVSDFHLNCSCLQAAALVREFDTGALAGSLSSFTVHTDTVGELVAEYDSVLPWPLAPRHLLVSMRFGVTTSTTGERSLVILGRDVSATALQLVDNHDLDLSSSASPTSKPSSTSDKDLRFSGDGEAAAQGSPHTRPSTPQRPTTAGRRHSGAVQGACHFSLYHIIPEGDGCRVRRAINIDMHLPLIPAAVLTPMLLKNYQQDVQHLHAQIKNWSGSEFQVRMATRPFYSTVQPLLQPAGSS